MKVAVLGFGTIGVGIYDMLLNANGLEQGPVLVREGKNDMPFKVTDIDTIVSDESVGAVCEAMGGVDIPFEYACKVLASGKHFVTSNKALVSAKGIELAKLAQKNGVAFLFSAACGGGVPFLHNMSLAVEGDEIESVGGILNGTTNYMLDAIQRRGMTYDEALKDAQKLGYAEADPTADVTGLDALRKIMLACAVAYSSLPNEGLNNEGIDSFTATDAQYLKSKDLTCRLIASAVKSSDKISAFVEPVVFDANSPECSVLLNFNMAKYVGKCAGKIVLMGQGAGRYPTASAVIRDLSDILSGRRFMMSPETVYAEADNNLCSHKYLIRVDKNDSLPADCESVEIFKDNKYAVSKALSVKEMHELANSIRSSGKKLFFAAINE